MNIVRIDMNDYNRVWVTSDIHGYYNLFTDLIDKIDLAKGDLLIVNGDSCDRGRWSFDIYEKIEDMKGEGYNIIHTLGNHEDLMIGAIERGEIYRWYRNGGRKTIDSYEKNWKLLENHLNIIKEMPIAVDLGRYFVVHAGIDPDLTIDDQLPYEMIWIRDKFIKNKLTKTDKVIVYGHTPNLDGRIHFLDSQKISIDCGSYDTGVIGAIELKAMDIIYVSTDTLDIYINPYFKNRL